MNRVALLLVIIVSSCAPVSQDDASTDDRQDVAPQAEPVLAWFKAVKDGDQDLLKSVFSKRMCEQFDEAGWGEVLKTYQDTFQKNLGDYELEDFTYDYVGTEDKGAVTVTHKGEDLPSLRVTNEDGEWKVDEH